MSRVDRRGAKWAGTPPGAIASSVADMDLPTPAFVLDAVAAELRRGPGYSSVAELRVPVDAGVAWTAREHGLALDPDRCVPIDSVAAGVAWLLARCTDVGDGVVRLRPTYPPLVDVVRTMDRDDRPVDLVADGRGGWALDLDALDRACRGARVLLWVSPHNPTGRVWRRDELAAVAELAVRHGLDVVADEVWGDLALDRSHLPFATVAAAVDDDLAGRTTTFVGTSKTWNLAGLGCGLAHAGSDALFDRLRGGGRLPLLAPPPRASLAAATAAWTAGAGWRDDVRDLVRRNRDAAVDRLGAVFGSDRVTPPEGTYLLWLDLRGLVPADDPMAVLAVPDGVVPSDGAAYGAPGFVRLNLATTPATATRTAARVAALVGGA